MIYKLKRILILFSLIAAGFCQDEVDSDSPDTTPTKPQCLEPKSYWNGWECACPTGTPSFDEDLNQCLECTNGRIWNSDYESCKCPTDEQDFNEDTNVCECSGGRIFNSTSVTCGCTFGRTWNSYDEKCNCPQSDQVWNHKKNICECPGGRIWNSTSEDCECSGGRSWDSIEEICICEHGKTFNEENNECLCQDGKVWILEENECACPSNYQWNGTFCETKDKSCEIGKKWNGLECVPYCQKYEQLVEESCEIRCHRYEIWDDDKQKCIKECGAGEIFDEYFNTCHVKCEVNYTWDDGSEICVFECPSRQHFVDGQCVCEEGFKMNGKECVEEKEELPSCSEGYTLGIDNKCYKSVSITCPPDYEDVDGVCRKKQVTPMKCPNGFIYNESVKKCVSAIDPVCAPGSVFSDGVCVESITIRPTCPEGFVYRVDKCVKIKETDCPEGYEKRSGRCFKKIVCTKNQHNKDGVCIEIECPTEYILKNGVCEIPKEDNCPEGYVLEDGKCKRKIDSKCPDGYSLINGTCKRTVDDNCPEGYTLENGTCKRDVDDNCPIGYALLDGACRRTVEGECPEGFELKEGTCKRETIEECPSGYALIDGTCRRVLDPTCPSGLTLINGICKREVNDNCPTGYVLIEDICTRQTIHECPQGYALEGGVCKPEVVGKLTCPDAYVLYKGDCINECPELFHNQNGKCVPNDSESLIKPCKDDEIIINGKCFKVICPDGFVILDNRCIEVSCPEGYVWFEGSCKTEVESGAGAVFEINNYIYNHVTRNFTETPTIPIQNTNVVNVYVDGNNACTGNDCGSDINCDAETDCSIVEQIEEIEESTFKPPALIHTTPLPIFSSTTFGPKLNCCRIITPRVCKKYDDKWLCYNKNFQDCSEFCAKPVVYLKPPHAIYKPPVLIVPPNPPLESCQSENCEGPNIDCSGCAEYKKGTCSPYCYDYHCVNRDCTYFRQDEYCRKYPFSVGCTYNFGCIGDWCNGSAVGINPNEKLEKPCSEKK